MQFFGAFNRSHYSSIGAGRRVWRLHRVCILDWFSMSQKWSYQLARARPVVGQPKNTSGTHTCSVTPATFCSRASLCKEGSDYVCKPLEVSNNARFFFLCENHIYWATFDSITITIHYEENRRTLFASGEPCTTVQLAKPNDLWRSNIFTNLLTIRC